MALIALTALERDAIDAEILKLRTQLEDDADQADGGPARTDHTNLLVGSTIALAIVAVGAIVTIFLARPDKDNTALVATLMGMLVPLMTALLAAAVQQVHAAVNSRLTQLLRVTASKSRAEGVLAQKAAQLLIDRKTGITTPVAEAKEGTSTIPPVPEDKKR